jgi:hypothetical protein
VLPLGLMKKEGKISPAKLCRIAMEEHKAA